MKRDFRNIKAWKSADDLATLVYSATKTFPKEELYGLVSQIRRAAVSIPSNIAEGAARKTIKEYLQFLYIAQGSISELEYLLHLSKRIGYLKDSEYNNLDGLRDETAKMLYGLINYIEKETKAP
ncbi:MAG: four helix bundle protein [Phycisphaerae bacterium]|nr:four helix bundle protein [Phycisphaerae bacterium]